mmetsp:Transcript_30391/g.48751  ORF Transcript_30391/g.48751 Transcript_30391/m.48751 type:complete len:209 (-) Transcript_30391:786-1412(-)
MLVTLRMFMDHGEGGKVVATVMAIDCGRGSMGRGFRRRESWGREVLKFTPEVSSKPPHLPTNPDTANQQLKHVTTRSIPKYTMAVTHPQVAATSSLSPTPTYPSPPHPRVATPPCPRSRSPSLPGSLTLRRLAQEGQRITTDLKKWGRRKGREGGISWLVAVLRIREEGPTLSNKSHLIRQSMTPPLLLETSKSGGQNRGRIGENLPV